jgi:hypothetical protein
LEQAEFPDCPDLGKIGRTHASFEFRASEFFQEIDQWAEISEGFGDARDSVFAPAVPSRSDWVNRQNDDVRSELRARVENLDYQGWRGLMSRSRDCLRENLAWHNEVEEAMPHINTLDI